MFGDILFDYFLTFFYNRKRLLVAQQLSAIC
jgi:hypothetical protein